MNARNPDDAARRVPDWWRRPRKVAVVVDNDSWILPHATDLVDAIMAQGDRAVLARVHDDVPDGVVAFYLGCVSITPPQVLARNRYNLVVHESDLPQGRGFAPLTWAILEGSTRVTVCLLEAGKEVDAGSVYIRQDLVFDGTELNVDIRRMQGHITRDLCLQFLAATIPPFGIPQTGIPSWYARRRPKDSRINPEATFADQFNLLRVADNERYPAFFEMNGRRYSIKIEDIGSSNDDI